MSTTPLLLALLALCSQAWLVADILQRKRLFAHCQLAKWASVILAVALVIAIVRGH